MSDDLDFVEDFIICTYPRSGSHYLKSLIRQKLGVNVRKNHDPLSQVKNKITIIRNPLDSVTSAMVMEHRDPMRYTPEKLDDQVVKYDLFYEEIINNFEHIINYEVLKNNPDAVIGYLSKQMNLPILENEYVDDLDSVQEKFPKYLITTKSKPVLYNLTKEYYLGRDLSPSWALYYKALEKKSI